MSSETPSEPMIESLFLRFAFIYLADYKPILFAPTTIKEQKEGYDALLNMGCRQIIIQFKRADIRKNQYRKNQYRKNQFAISMRRKPSKGFNVSQHDILLRKAEQSPHTVFYVGATFDDPVNTLNKQKDLSPDEFLNHYAAFCLEDLDDESHAIYFDRDQSYWPQRANVKIKNDRSSGTPVRLLKGTELLSQFKNGTVGQMLTRHQALTKSFELDGSTEPSNNLFDTTNLSGQIHLALQIPA